MSNKRIAVVGAGAFGSWIALLAARAGFDTTLIDRYGPANELSSSAGPSRIIRRAYGPDEIYTLLAQRSRELWITFLAEENRSHCFRRTGVLWLANGGEASIHAARRIFQRHKLTHEFLEIGAIRRLCPAMDVPFGTVALFEPDCGALLAQESIREVVESAVRNGARSVSGRVESSGLEQSRAVRSLDFLEIENGESIEADVFVFACGSWLPKLFPEALGTAIFPTRQEVFFFETPAEWAQSDAASLPIWVDQVDPRIPYVFPDIDGAGVKVAFHRTGPRFDPDSGSREVGREQITEAAEYLRMRFPAIRAAVFRRAQVCHYENTSSGDFLIDRHPSMRNVWFAGGGSGHGFKHGPAVAEYLLEAIRRGYSPEPRFRLEGKGKELARRVV
jgi:sarcosine oxidase